MATRRTWTTRAAGWFALLLLVSACSKMPPAPPARKNTNVETWIVAPTDLKEEIALPALLRADRTVVLSAEVSGAIRRIHADVGDEVEAGAELLAFDDTDLVLLTKQAESGVKALEAALAEARRGAREQQVREAEVGLEAARASLELAKTLVERRRALAEEKVIPLEVLDQAQLQLQQAQAGHDRAREMLDLVREGASQETIRGMEAQLEGARASLALARSRLSKAVVLSPFAGVVIRRHMEENEFAGPGMPLFDLIPRSPVKVSLGVPERIFGRLSKGDPVQVSFPGLGLAVESSIAMLAPAANPATQTFTVEMEIENPVVLSEETAANGGPRRVPLRPGLIADVRFTLGVRLGSVVIPGDALVLRGDAFVVFVLEGTTVRVRPVMIGLKHDGQIEITEGLEAGARLVIEGQKQVRSGDEVTLVKEHTGPLADLAR